MGQEEEEDERDDDGNEQRRGNPVALCNLLVDIFIYFSFQNVQPLWSSRPSLAAERRRRSQVSPFHLNWMCVCVAPAPVHGTAQHVT
jgi:hypothetical protein